MVDPKWLKHARTFNGQREFPGKKHNPVIIRWWQAIKAAIRDDESPWCAAYVGGVLEECGIRSTRKANARSYADNWGLKLARPALGAVVVFWRGKPNGWQGHVGFIAGRDKAGNLMVIGGNQGNAVSVKPFDVNRVIGYYWPQGTGILPNFTLPLLASDGKLSTNEA